MTIPLKRHSLKDIIAELICDKCDRRIGLDLVRQDHPLGNLGLSIIELCDLVVSLEDNYGIAIDQSPEEVGEWTLSDITATVKKKLLETTLSRPTLKDSFEGLVFTGQAKALRTPLSVHLDISFRCNMKCVFCYDSSGSPQNSEELSTEQLKEIIDQCAYLDVVDITWGGGEPFIRKDFMELLKYSSQRRLRNLILTNGTWITPEIARELSGCLDMRFDLVQVSLDGPTAEVHDFQRGVAGGFEKTMAGIRHLQAAGISPTINSVLTRHNYRFIEDMISFLLENGVNSYRVLRLHPLGRGRDRDFYEQWVVPPEETESVFELLYRKRAELIGELKISDDFACIFPWSAARVRNGLAPMPGKEPQSYACGAGTTKLSIGPDGSVFPCSYMYEFPELKIGSLTEDTLETIWNDESRWKIYREPLKPSGKCRSCEYLFYCRTGCRAVSYALHGDMGAPDAGCSYEPGSHEPGQNR